MSETKGALSSIRVLDLSRVFAGPVCTQILGDLGAEVIKVERPHAGDDGRYYGFFSIPDENGKKTQESSFFLCANRNKKSVTVNIAKPEGQELLRELAAQCDVVVENYKVGDLKRYGLDYETLKCVNPRVIYCSITGYGQTGPNATKPGYDGLFQAMGGLMSVTGIPDGQPGSGPLKTGPSLVDFVTGHNAGLAVLAALLHREQSGRGQYIDIALLDCSVAMVSHVMQDYLLSGVAPPRLGNGGNGGGPSDLIECKDGMIYMTAGTEDHWVRLTNLMQRPDLREDPRFLTFVERGRGAARLDLIEIISQWSRAWLVKDLLVELDRIGIPAARYNELHEVFDDAQVQHRGLKVTVPHPLAPTGDVALIASPLAKMSETPIEHYATPPLLGEHTNAVLKERLGFDDARIAQLRERGVI